MRITKRWIFALALGSQGCGAAVGDGGGKSNMSGDASAGGAGDPAIEMRCLDSVELSAEAADRTCACEVEAGGYPDLASCLDVVLTPASTYECICPIYAEHPESRAFIDCYVALREIAVECEAEAGCDQDRRGACTEAFQKYLDCPSPGAAADEAAAACDLP